MPPTVIATGDKVDEITSVVQGYYDCDNVFNFYRQVGTTMLPLGVGGARFPHLYGLIIGILRTFNHSG
ncbi:unnamed protein product [Ectocarpus sp. CCAP 1310/34]|nr:unnamed protein product [Ectocarpus sp. CCAP 1310/34]